VQDLAYPIGEDPLVIGCSPDTGLPTVPMADSSDIDGPYGKIWFKDGCAVMENPHGRAIFVDGVRVEGLVNLKLGQTVQVGTSGDTLRLIACLNSDET
jgi:hypothetical protein